MSAPHVPNEYDRGFAAGLAAARQLNVEPTPAGRERIVADFIAQREEYVRVLRQCVGADADYHRWQGHAEARRQLRDKLAAHPAGSAPQSVDREALLQEVAEAIDDLDGVPPMGTPADHLERRAARVTDAVLALLNGEAQ